MGELLTPSETQTEVRGMPIEDATPRPHSHKICQRCNDKLPRSEFSRNSSAKDGLQIWCRPCVREYGVLKRAKEKRRKHSLKTCRSCDGEFPKRMFHKNAATGNGYSYDCKPCRSAEYKKRAAKKRAAAVEMKRLEHFVSRHTIFSAPRPSLLRRVLSWFSFVP